MCVAITYVSGHIMCVAIRVWLYYWCGYMGCDVTFIAFWFVPVGKDLQETWWLVATLTLQQVFRK
jgi:hypothetical protein